MGLMVPISEATDVNQQVGELGKLLREVVDIK